MWPWGHLGFAYVCYLGALKVRDRSEQTFLTVAAVAFGSQFPDLVDKPLAWTFGVLPSGRSFAHSLLTAAIILSVLYWLGMRWKRTEAVTAFGVGYLSHSFVDLGPDVVFGLLRGDASQLTWTTYLLWPVLPAPPYPNDQSFMEHFANMVLDPYMLFQIALFFGAIWLWVRSGRPGMAAVRLRIRRWTES